MQEIVSFNEGLASPKDAESYISWDHSEQLYGKLMIAEGGKFETVKDISSFLTNDDTRYIRAELFVVRDGIRVPIRDWFCNISTTAKIQINKAGKFYYVRLTPQLCVLSEDDEVLVLN